MFFMLTPVNMVGQLRTNRSSKNEGLSGGFFVIILSRLQNSVNNSPLQTIPQVISNSFFSLASPVYAPQKGTPNMTKTETERGGGRGRQRQRDRQRDREKDRETDLKEREWGGEIQRERGEGERDTET